MKYTSLDQRSLAQRIAEQIQDAIITGSLRVDQRLPTETELAERYSVSRPTIREALKRLAAKKLIRSQRGPQGGTFVNRLSYDDVQDTLINHVTLMVSLDAFSLEEIAQARQQLEGACCTLAAKRGDPHQLEIMAHEISVQSDPEISDEAFCASDVRFHRALVDGANNPVLSFLLSSVIEALQPATNMVIFHFRDRQKVTKQHQEILACMRARDAQGAREALERYMACLQTHYAQAQAWRTARLAQESAKESAQELDKDTDKALPNSERTSA